MHNINSNIAHSVWEITKLDNGHHYKMRVLTNIKPFVTYNEVAGL